MKLHFKFLNSFGHFSKLAVTLTTASLIGVGCAQNNNVADKNGKIAAGVRPLNQAERAADFDQMLQLFKTYYGPYNYKQELFRMNIEQEAARLKDLAVNAKSDEEFAGYVMQFAALLKDGHVGAQIKNSASGISRYIIPIVLVPVENKTLVGMIDPTLSEYYNIEKGDELIEIDGKTPESYLPTISKYVSDATELSQKVNILFALSRPSYMTDLIPTSTTAQIKVKKENNTVITVSIPWTLRKYNADLDKMHKPADTNARIDARAGIADHANSIIADVTMMGNDNPFFLSDAAKAKFGFIKVYPSAENLKKAGLKDNERPPIYAALYRHQGKNILLVRIASYSPSDFSSSVYMKAYKALFKEFQSISDVLVLDQTHNPGGSYCASFYELFAKQDDAQAVQKCNADRKWINSLGIDWPKLAMEMESPWDARESQAMALKVEKAYDAGERLSEAIPIFTGNTVVDPTRSVWKKPMLVLIDELAGSCGDVFPMLVKANKRAKLFGQQTMGLGGNVESVGELNNSRISLRLTRGIFTTHKADGNYQQPDFVENNGVMPDIAYSHTVDDVRGGYTAYIQAFSDQAVKEIPAPATPAADPTPAPTPDQPANPPAAPAPADPTPAPAPAPADPTPAPTPAPAEPTPAPSPAPAEPPAPLPAPPTNGQ
jgi:C-terminal processing protease CtpA/Prc